MANRKVRVRLERRDEGGYRLFVQGPDVDGRDTKREEIPLPADVPERSVEFHNEAKLLNEIERARLDYEHNIMPLLALSESIEREGSVDAVIERKAKQEMVFRR